MGYGNNKDIKIPKAKEGRTTKKSEKKMKLDDNIVASAKHVAKDLGGDVKKTEEDLISSLKQFLIDPGLLKKNRSTYVIFNFLNLC